MGPVPSTVPDTRYRLAPALGLRLVGRSLISLAGLVVLATLLGLLFDTGWALAGVVTLVGLLAVAGWAWYLLQRANAVHLSEQGYDVRLLGGVGTTSAAWADVSEVAAASPGGTPCLVLRLADGRGTRLPMPALACDPDVLARDVRRRVRDAHTEALPDTGADTGDSDADSDPGPSSS
jgi:hypothetical protein